MALKDQVYDKDYYRGKRSNYIFWYKNLKSGFFWRRRLKFLSKIASSGRLLDAGCAFGFFLKLLDKDFEVYGVDISSYAIEQARNLVSNPSNLKVFDVRKGLPFDVKFDVITAFDIMEHINEPAQVFSTLNDCLKAKGYLYFEVPLKDTLINRDIGHLYRPLEAWLDFLKQAGFEPKLIQTYYTIGFRAIMISTQRFVNYCAIIAEKIS